MPTVHINTTPYEVPQQVYDTLVQLQSERDSNYEAALTLQGENKHLKYLIRNLHIKKHTAQVKGTKNFRIEAWEAEREMFAAVGYKVVEREIDFITK